MTIAVRDPKTQYEQDMGQSSKLMAGTAKNCIQVNRLGKTRRSIHFLYNMVNKIEIRGTHDLNSRRQSHQ